MLAGQVVMSSETVDEEPEGEAPVPVSQAKKKGEAAKALKPQAAQPEAASSKTTPTPHVRT